MYVLLKVSDFIYLNFKAWEFSGGNVFALPFIALIIPWKLDSEDI